MGDRFWGICYRDPVVVVFLAEVLGYFLRSRIVASGARRGGVAEVNPCLRNDGAPRLRAEGFGAGKAGCGDECDASLGPVDSWPMWKAVSAVWWRFLWR